MLEMVGNVFSCICRLDPQAFPHPFVSPSSYLPPAFHLPSLNFTLITLFCSSSFVCIPHHIPFPPAFYFHLAYMNFSTPSLVPLPSWRPENRQQNHTRRLSRRRFSWHNDLRLHENYARNYMDAGLDPEAVDISLDVSSIVLSTLRDASKFSPVPFLSAAAGIAIDIVGTVQVSYSSLFSNWTLQCVSQKARRNKDGFKALADDSCELVYVIIRAYKDRPGTDDMP